MFPLTTGLLTRQFDLIQLSCNIDSSNSVKRVKPDFIVVIIIISQFSNGEIKLKPFKNSQYKYLLFINKIYNFQFFMPEDTAAGPFVEDCIDLKTEIIIIVQKLEEERPTISAWKVDCKQRKIKVLSTQRDFALSKEDMTSGYLANTYIAAQESL